MTIRFVKALLSKQAIRMKPYYKFTSNIQFMACEEYNKLFHINLSQYISGIGGQKSQEYEWEQDSLFRNMPNIISLVNRIVI